MKAVNKRYALTSSCLYRCNTITSLARFLGISVDKLRKLDNQLRESSKEKYRVFPMGESQREIQQPINGLLIKLQKRIFILLSNIEMPDYVHSARRGRSYITNASEHINNCYTLTMDIRKFYASTRAEAVFQFFLYDMQMKDDLAHILTNICLYDNRIIPT